MGMIGMSVGHDGAVYRAPRIDIEIAGRAVQTIAGYLKHLDLAGTRRNLVTQYIDGNPGIPTRRKCMLECVPKRGIQ